MRRCRGRLPEEPARPTGQNRRLRRSFAAGTCAETLEIPKIMRIFIRIGAGSRTTNAPSVRRNTGADNAKPTLCRESPPPPSLCSAAPPIPHSSRTNATKSESSTIALFPHSSPLGSKYLHSLYRTRSASSTPQRSQRIKSPRPTSSRTPYRPFPFRFFWQSTLE